MSILVRSNPIVCAAEFVFRIVADVKKAKRAAVREELLGWKGPFEGE